MCWICMAAAAGSPGPSDLACPQHAAAETLHVQDQSCTNATSPQLLLLELTGSYLNTHSSPMVTSTRSPRHHNPRDSSSSSSRSVAVASWSDQLHISCRRSPAAAHPSSTFCTCSTRSAHPGILYASRPSRPPHQLTHMTSTIWRLSRGRHAAWPKPLSSGNADSSSPQCVVATRLPRSLAETR